MSLEAEMKILRKSVSCSYTVCTRFELKNLLPKWKWIGNQNTLERAALNHVILEIGQHCLATTFTSGLVQIQRKYHLSCCDQRGAFLFDPQILRPLCPKDNSPLFNHPFASMSFASFSSETPSTCSRCRQ